MQEKLLNELVEKLMTITDGKMSSGVKDFLDTEIIPRGVRFNAETLKGINYETVNLSKWTNDAHKNSMIRATVMNYLRKSKTIDAELRRKKSDIRG